MERLLTVISGILVLVLFSGCSTKQVVKHEVIHIKKEKPYQFTHTPIIGTQNADEKVIVNMGTVMRIWINSYKDRSGNLVASHDVYTWMKKPDFIVGAELPIRNRGLITPDRKLPVMLSNSEVDRSDINSNKNIKKYVNSIYQKQKGQPKEKTITSPQDVKIKDFLKSIKNQNKEN